MINFSLSTPDDLPQIAEWISADPYHQHLGQPEWWITGNGILAFCLMDDVGPLTYVRLDDEGEYARIHIQFAPEEVVSKRRLVVGLIRGLQMVLSFIKDRGYKGLVFESVSPTLIAFFQKQGFKPVGGTDYRLDFEGE
jgi:hypothetical protein